MLLSSDDIALAASTIYEPIDKHLTIYNFQQNINVQIEEKNLILWAINKPILKHQKNATKKSNL